MLSEKECIKAIGIIGCYLNCDEMSTEEFNDSIVVLNNLINEHFELVKEYETYKKINRFEKECEKFYCKENYFNIIIKALCDCKDKELQDNAVHCLAYLKLQLDNPSLKFEKSCITCSERLPEKDGIHFVHY